ncbi:hypothetical protein FB451DRAFT_1189547 [Mycena latifolia]|nr:hypothetical protein FB451DRAFT_1189547 [Mycena latifolia]
MAATFQTWNTAASIVKNLQRRSTSYLLNIIKSSAGKEKIVSRKSSFAKNPGESCPEKRSRSLEAHVCQNKVSSRDIRRSLESAAQLLTACKGLKQKKTKTKTARRMIWEATRKNVCSLKINHLETQKSFMKRKAAFPKNAEECRETRRWDHSLHKQVHRKAQVVIQVGSGGVREFLAGHKKARLNASKGPRRSKTARRTIFEPEIEELARRRDATCCDLIFN